MTTVLERPTELKQSKTALHVEDSPSVQALVEVYLTDAGFDVVQTDNFEDAEAHIRRQSFDVYVFDGQFPLRRGSQDQDGSGIELYDKVREMRSPVNCIILSGSDLRQECDKRGIEFMYKGTFDGKALLNYLSRIH